MLEIKCPTCARQLQMPEDAAELECQCPTCMSVFLPREVTEKPRRLFDSEPAGQSTEAIRSLTPGQTDYREELEELAEQASVGREPDAALGIADDFGEYRWGWSIRGALLSIALSGLVWAFSLAHGQQEGLCVFLSLAVAAAVLGGAHGALIAWGAHATGPSRRVWAARILGGFLLAAVITPVFTNWQSFPPLYFLLTVSFIAIPFMVFLVLMIKGVFWIRT